MNAACSLRLLSQFAFTIFSFSRSCHSHSSSFFIMCTFPSIPALVSLLSFFNRKCKSMAIDYFFLFLHTSRAPVPLTGLLPPPSSFSAIANLGDLASYLEGGSRRGKGCSNFFSCSLFFCCSWFVDLQNPKLKEKATLASIYCNH